MRLKRNVIRSVLEAEEKERLRKLYGSKDKWIEAVELFFKYVETRYLDSLINEGLVSVSRAKLASEDARRIDTSNFSIRFGHVVLKLTPVFATTTDSLGYISVKSSIRQDAEDYIVCDLTKGWLAPVREAGIRRLLSGYLPEKLAPLSQELFSDILCDLIEVHEPIVTYDRDKVLQRFSHLLDDILDPAKKHAISEFLSKVKLLPSLNSIKKLAEAAQRSGPLSFPPSTTHQNSLLSHQNTLSCLPRAIDEENSVRADFLS